MFHLPENVAVLNEVPKPKSCAINGLNHKPLIFEQACVFSGNTKVAMRVLATLSCDMHHVFPNRPVSIHEGFFLKVKEFTKY